jgi:hypothetical protein
MVRPEESQDMTDIQLIAFVITPLALLALGWGVALWTVYWGRSDRSTPAE